MTTPRPCDRGVFVRCAFELRRGPSGQRQSPARRPSRDQRRPGGCRSAPAACRRQRAGRRGRCRSAAPRRREQLLGLVVGHHLDVGDLAAAELGEIGHAHQRYRSAALSRLTDSCCSFPRRSLLLSRGLHGSPLAEAGAVWAQPESAQSGHIFPRFAIRKLWRRRLTLLICRSRSCAPSVRARGAPDRSTAIHHSTPQTFTSMPSAKTNVRLNCRAAMPR